MFMPPAEVEAATAPFAALFTRPSWQRAQALLCGMLLALANSVLTAALRVLGLSDDRHFQNYHRVLNRARWSAHHAAGIQLRLLVQAFVPVGPVVTFQETRVYFGVEGQRQWNDLAVARSTPLRLALFSLVALLV